MLFMAEEHPSISGRLGQWSAASGSSGVAGAVDEAPLKQRCLMGWRSGLRQEGLLEVDAMSMQLGCQMPACLARGVSGKVRW